MRLVIVVAGSPYDDGPDRVPPALPESAAHEAFVEDPLFAVADVRLNKGLPLGLIGCQARGGSARCSLVEHWVRALA